MSKRDEYMRHEMTFHDYYGLLVEHIGEDFLRSILPGDRTPEQWGELLAEDEHLNNVPLRQWDDRDHLVRARAFGGDDLRPITGSNGWSLSDSVCVLKETARRYAAEASTAAAIESTQFMPDPMPMVRDTDELAMIAEERRRRPPRTTHAGSGTAEAVRKGTHGR